MDPGSAAQHFVLRSVRERGPILRSAIMCYLKRGARHDWGYGCGECPACALRAKGWREYAGS
jgi:7-cyano-7-deazaguanine synthase in queuosine biosynthesis